MGRDRVTNDAIHNGELAEYLIMAGLEESVKSDEFLCDGCGKSMTINEVSFVRAVKPKAKVYCRECFWKVDEAERD